MKLERSPAIGVRAADDLRFIRTTMERAVSFTAVPGWGGVLMGVVALAAALFAARVHDITSWISIWFVAAAAALIIGSSEMAQNMRRAGTRLISRAGARFALGLLPAFFAAACLTWVLVHIGLGDRLASVWLLLYGTAVCAVGASSIRPVCEMGLAFLVVGALAALSPSAWSDVYMAIGFGGLHILAGLWIAKVRHA